MNNYGKLAILISIYVILCLLYVFCLCLYIKKDLLLMKIGIGSLNLWSITHFIAFFIIGFLFPDFKIIILAFSLGIIWEFLEFFIGAKKNHKWICNFYKDKNFCNRWFGALVKWSDILMNLFGLLVGFLFSKLKKD